MVFYIPFFYTSLLERSEKDPVLLHLSATKRKIIDFSGPEAKLGSCNSAGTIRAEQIYLIRRIILYAN